MSTGIEWTDVVWNPTTGCDKVSPGCGMPRFDGDDAGGCYAMAMAKRLKGMGQAKYQNDGDPSTSGPGFGVTMHPDVLDLPLSWRKPRRVFVNSMSDLFHDDVPDEYIAQVFAVMAACPQHTFQVLTKRHARMRSLLNRFLTDRLVSAVSWDMGQGFVDDSRWPLPNVHLGVSTEDQKWADIRIPALLDTPAAVRWISAEPLLGPIDLGEYVQAQCECCDPAPGRPCVEDPAPPSLDWVVVGGESGRGARPIHPSWARSLRDQCAAAGVPFLFKQWGQFQPQNVKRYSELLQFSDPSRGCVVELDGRTSVAWTMSGRDLRDDGATADGVAMLNVGKSRADRVLDGRIHDEYPAVAS